MATAKPKAPKKVKPKVNPLKPKAKKVKPKVNPLKPKAKKVAGAGAFYGSDSKTKGKKSVLSKKARKA